MIAHLKRNIAQLYASWLVVVARGLYLARHLFTLSAQHQRIKVSAINNSIIAINTSFYVFYNSICKTSFHFVLFGFAAKADKWSIAAPTLLLPVLPFPLLLFFFTTICIYNLPIARQKQK